MKKLLPVFALAAGLAVLAGCSTPQSRIKDNPAAFASLTAGQQQLVKEGKVGLGFDMAMVRLALGEPDHIRTRTEPGGTSEIWSYVTHYGDFDAFPYGGYYNPYRYGMVAPYYPYLPYRGYYPASVTGEEREHFRVVFQNGRVVMIEQEN